MNDILYVIIEKTPKGFPAIWVGGGAAARQFSAQFVLRDGKLAPAILTKSAGSWYYTIEQALVPLQKGDILVGVGGGGSFPQARTIPLSEFTGGK